MKLRQLYNQSDYGQAVQQHWGFPWRRGLFAVSRTDFVRIAQAMQATFAE